MSEARADILGRVRRAQRSKLQQHEILEALTELGVAPPAPRDAEDILESFKLRLKLNHASLEACATRAEAVQLISHYVYQRCRTRKVVTGYDPRLAAMPWRDGGVLVRFDAATAEDPLSISYAKLAIAESGSLILFSNRSNPAANNWLVQDHIILLDQQDLVADFEQAWEKIREHQIETGSPRGISFISGPSSTADIKGHLVFGAHGPQRLHIIFIGPEALPP
ncbi:MAG: LUD domain-containing protein [Gammaproteobacteria bacterium]|nr:LUD domain-containing protein [Gammaproteobacteria bacterium]